MIEDRLKNLEAKLKLDDPGKKLLQLGRIWYKNHRNNRKEALKARKRAEPILKAHPKFREETPFGTKRNLHLAWKDFLNYGNDE